MRVSTSRLVTPRLFDKLFQLIHSPFLQIISALLVAFANARPQQESGEEDTSVWSFSFNKLSKEAVESNDATTENPRVERQFPVFQGNFNTRSEASPVQESADTFNEQSSRGFGSTFSQDLTLASAEPASQSQFPVASADNFQSEQSAFGEGFPVFQGGFSNNRNQEEQAFPVTQREESRSSADDQTPAPSAIAEPFAVAAPTAAAVPFAAALTIPLSPGQSHGYGHSHNSYAPRVPHNEPNIRDQPLPKCAENNPKSWCLEDPEYPAGEIRRTLTYHFDDVINMYRDVKVKTDNSVAGLLEIIEETYLCPAEVAYIKPLRAINKNGEWRWIVNDIDAHYEVLTQTARIEECTTGGQSCPLVPDCYETKCLQKSNYHRFLVYDRYDRYLPFSIESFKLPSSCACYNGAYNAPYVAPYKV